MSSWLTPQAIVQLLTCIGTILGAMQLSGRRQRKRMRLLAARNDALEQRVWDVRRIVRTHNGTAHPEGEGALELPPLPEWMGSTHDQGDD